jgi:mannosyltransferase
LIGVLMLAAALRLIALNSRPLWYDEAFAILYAEKSLSAILSGTLTPVQGVAADVHPVAFYFSLHGWMALVGQTPLAARMLSVMYGVGTVALAYRLMRDLVSSHVACWSAFVVALAPFQIAYSQEARMYAMLGFWSTATLAAFVCAWRTDSLRAWMAFIVCGALTLYSHNLGFVTLFVLSLWAIVRAVFPLTGPGGWRDRNDPEMRRRWELVGKLAIAAPLIMLLFSPWLLHLPGQLGKIGQAYWVLRPGALTLVQTLIAFTFDFENAVFPRVLLPLALFGGVLVVAVIVWQILIRNTHKEMSTNFCVPSCKVWLLATLAFGPVALVFVISQWIPVYIIRGLIPASIVYAALAGWALAEMACLPRTVFGLPLGALVIAILTALYGYTGFPRGPYRELDAFLRAQLQPGDVIVHSNKLTFFPAYVYDRTLPQVFLGDPPGSGSDTLARPTQEALGLFPVDLESATAGKSRVWLVIFRQAIAEMKGNHPHVAWLSAHFSQTQTTTFGDMDVILFVRKDH